MSVTIDRTFLVRENTNVTSDKIHRIVFTYFSKREASTKTGEHRITFALCMSLRTKIKVNIVFGFGRLRRKTHLESINFNLYSGVVAIRINDKKQWNDQNEKLIIIIISLLINKNYQKSTRNTHIYR